MSNLTHEDYQQVALLHMECIDQGFLSTLGVSFLSLMYQSIDETNDAILFVEKDRNNVVGFVTGTSNMRSIYKQMIRHTPRLIAYLFPTMINPRKIWQVIEILRHSGGRGSLKDLPPHELLSIAVSKAVRGSGIAQQLYIRLAEHFRVEGISSFRIVVGEALTPAHGFYQKMGAVPVHEICVHGNDRSIIYIQQLNKA